MPTLMLDALAHEQNEISKLVAEGSRLAIEALRRSNLLHKQLEFLADEERAYRNSNTPGTYPQAQDSEEGNQGSGASAPGGAETRKEAEPEQAVADTASGERDAARKDPGADPDSYLARYNRTLDLYAEPGGTPRTIAKALGITAFAAEAHIRSGRANGDRRAAQGDQHRDIGLLTNPRKPKRVFTQPRRPTIAREDLRDEEPVREKPPGDLLILDLRDCVANYDGQSVQLVRWELRLLLLLNAGIPAPLDSVLEHCSFRTGRAFTEKLAALNPRLHEIGVRVVELVGHHYQLQPLELV